jgi:hypothetical protein
VFPVRYGLYLCVPYGSHSKQRVSESKPSARGYNWAILFLRDINTGTWPSRLGSLR